MLKITVRLLLFLAITITLVGCAPANLASGQIVTKTNTMVDNCIYWQSLVDTGIELPADVREIDKNDEQNIIEGITCLLTLEGNKNHAKFTGATNPHVSQFFKPATVEVVALYYVSYLYYQKWNHADAIALRNENGEVNTEASIKDAYKCYRAWFVEVKKIGIAKAREQKLDPLKGSSVNWY